MQVIRGEVIRLDSVSVAYSGIGRPAIEDINLSLEEGKLIIIAGPNGAGKTTLIETCLGLLKPLTGKVLLLGVDTKSRKIIDVRKLCSYVPQDFMRPPFESYTARHVIELGLAVKKQLFELSNLHYVSDILSITKLLGIDKLLDNPIGILSGGEQQKVFIARALAREPRILFLDEPFSSLDRDSREIVASIIRKYADVKKATAIIVSHDLNPVESIADEIVVMEKGRIVKADER